MQTIIVERLTFTVLEFYGADGVVVMSQKQLGTEQIQLLHCHSVNHLTKKHR